MWSVSINLAFFVRLFVVASLLPSSLVAKIDGGLEVEEKQLFKTGQLCKSHDDCRANTVYSANFCINKIIGSETGECVGFDSTSAILSKSEDNKCKSKKEKKKKKEKKQKKSKKPKAGGCGKCETDEDCKSCPIVTICEKYVADGLCM